MSFEGLIEQMLGHFTAGDFLPEVTAAKREFFIDAGILNDESVHFEMRMAQFLDWYLFTRELSKQQVPPVRLAQQLAEFTAQGDAVDALLKAHHSLFEYVKIRGTDVYLRDLFDGRKYLLKNSHVTVGFNQDEIFETRLIPDGENFIFAKGFCFHPVEAKKFILQEVKKVRKLSQREKETLMLRLLKMRYKYEQYSHIRLDYIYTNDSKVKF